MKRRKQRVLQHQMEDESYSIIKNHLPPEWVVREFNRPDYGIDIVIELFQKIDDQVAETLGEFVFVQVKSKQSIEVKIEEIFSVFNVAKAPWKEDKSDAMEISVVKYQFDTDSLFSIETLGASVSVLLIYVDIQSCDCYFVCLNDYLDKIILPQKPAYANQDSLMITVPAINNLKNKDITNNAFKFYGKRAKLLSAFSKFAFQKNEISYLLGYKDYPVWTYRDDLQKEVNTNSQEICNHVLYFIGQIENLDIWDHAEWAVLPLARLEIISLKSAIEQNLYDWQTLKNNIILVWHRLGNLVNMYEDICREWFLPKKISFMLSYPEDMISTKVS